ncbi:hypothetical protein A1353_14575 [Methylomonas methanica]|uniref:Uncharacterized protein n=2 Tax=Methylomonas methanica TaxID=421 RepID=A0A177MCN9_METMH|nr:hypothetical protein A1353_14575 [Methylomonas methanica]
MLGEVKMITSISVDNKEILDTFWADSGLLPVVAENNTGISECNGKPSTFSNFCPEVTFAYFGYYASYLTKYADEIDKDSGHRIAERESLHNDWRHEWAHISACHFLECSSYNQVHDFNSKGISKFDKLAHDNVVALIYRMEQCLEINDPSGALHAAANILETTAKDIMKSEKIQDQTLGSFIEKYKTESNLPDDIKEVVEKIYNLRNRMPLSGHGSTRKPNMNIYDAIVIAATVKFIVEIEYRSRTI